MPTPSQANPGQSQVRRLFVLLCGFEILPKTVSTRGRGGRFILSEPVCAYLLDTAAGWILLDTGLNAANARDPARVTEKFLSAGMAPPVVRDAHGLERQLAGLGLTPADIRHVVLSHLHYDHAGNIGMFRHARLSVQRREFRQAFTAPGAGYFRDEYDLPGLQWDLVDGDWEVLPGLEFIETRGHTEGHQSAIVTLAGGGRFVLPFDAADLQENLDLEVLPGEACDDEAALEAIQRINRLRAEPGTQCLLFHDPVAIQALRLCPDAYE